MNYLRNLRCIDSHSHFSINEGEEKVGVECYFPREGNINDYYELAVKNNIVEAMLMPCPTPIIIRENGRIINTPITWQERNGKIVYFCRNIENGKEKIFEPKDNPYSEINFRLREYLLNYNSKEVKFNFIPLIHLVFDTPDYVDELISLKPKAFKVHGIGLGLDDFSKINTALLKKIGKSKIPIIVHTDFMDGIPKSKIEEVYKANDSLNWISILEKYEIRALLTHGVRLCEKSADIVKNSQLFCVGISPDLLIQSEPARIKMKGDYLKKLITLVGTEYLLFDMDFPWNIADRETFEPDNGIIKRMKEYITDSELEDVVYNNAKSFFN